MLSQLIIVLIFYATLDAIKKDVHKLHGDL